MRARGSVVEAYFAIKSGGWVTQDTGEWGIHTKGKNHQNGCTGEGGPLSIEWEAVVTNITGTREEV
jgi:hypothetical protein